MWYYYISQVVCALVLFYSVGGILMWGPLNSKVLSIEIFPSYSNWEINILLTLSLPDQICHSPYCQPYNYYNVSSENLILDQLIIPNLTFFFILITYLPGGWYDIDIVLILYWYGIDIVLILYWYCKEKFSLSHSRVKCCFLSLYYLYKLGTLCFFGLNLGP